jgi:hypothetical protein
LCLKIALKDDEIHQLCIKPSWTIGQVKQLGDANVTWEIK